MRKAAKDSDEKGGEAADLGAGVDPLVGGEGVASSSGLAAVDTAKKAKRVKVTFPWEDERLYGELVPDLKDDDEGEQEEMDSVTAERLDFADKLTQGMTQEEYLHFSECRQASFTFRKGKKFREWAGIGVVASGKPNDDFIDMLGFVISEAVETLTKEALNVKRVDDAMKSRNAKIAAAATNSPKRKHEDGLFAPPPEGKTAIGPKHIQEAFRRLQEKPHPGYRPKPNLGGPMALRRRELRLVRTLRKNGVSMLDGFGLIRASSFKWDKTLADGSRVLAETGGTPFDRRAVSPNITASGKDRVHSKWQEIFSSFSSSQGIGTQIHIKERPSKAICSFSDY